ncbi:alpha/beta hydrolase fold domain-containing protein [Lutibacter sp. A80]|uniref:alpha/beta hydrolase fold domain-containing protein n=1 Tax=Lutibacter sp. A80 TaxID=2918453 RepID=UPI001F0671DB|nr:alpha/beta hydrolase fold domain-containing protein [Lutibacter sp. A80]UMB62096.1 alpha/beta hydrolase fold domain-containing protein [Lutibacter sp. A80]
MKTALLSLFVVLCNCKQPKKDQIKKTYTVLGLGDSITEGKGEKQSYLFPLWEKLFSAGYRTEFIGPNVHKCRIGSIMNAGYSGRNVEYLNAHIDSLYRKYPADIVLLHAGHNHFAEEHPISGIIAMHKSIIAKITAINPEVKILISQVIQSGKLPKYSYIPELNEKIAQMVEQLSNEGYPLTLVNQAEGFNWKEDCLPDKVHPNIKGAKKMANKWFDALATVLEKPLQSFNPEEVVYKKIDSIELKLHIFNSFPLDTEKKKACIVYFFGGAWKVGSPLQFYRECAYFASKGMVAISVDYRIKQVHGTSAFESVSDAKSAIRWIRENAGEYNIDTSRIVAAGASAGGHLAAATGTLSQFDEMGEDLSVSSKPNLLLLYYPVVDNGPGGYGSKEMKQRCEEISPIYNIDSETPPTLMIVGTKDPLLSVKQAELYQEKMTNAGSFCELKLYKNASHPIFYYRKGVSDYYYKILKDSELFLKKYSFL